MMQILSSPIAKHIYELFHDAQHEAYIVSPWIKYDAVQSILPDNPPFTLSVITRGHLQDFLSETSDFEAMKWLMAQRANIRLISNLHAKIYVADNTQCIVTSANFTPSGFGLAPSHGTRNVEFGMMVDDIEIITQIKDLLQRWISEGYSANSTWFSQMEHALQSQQNQLTQASIKKHERTLEKTGHELQGTYLSIKTFPTKNESKHTRQVTPMDKAIVAIPDIIQTVFPTRQECENAFQYFANALQQLPSIKQYQHIISTSYRPHERKLTLNIGNWEIVCFRKGREKLLATFCLDKNLFPDATQIPGYLKAWDFAGRWSENGAYHLVRLEWKSFIPSEQFYQAWYSSIHHAVNTFGHWRASSYMKSHRQDLLDLFLNSVARNKVFEQTVQEK